MRLIDLKGRQFGRLIAIERAGTSPGKQTLWRCTCVCGNTTVAHGSNLRSGHTTSCGCRQAEVRAAQVNTHHGLTGSPEHRTWSGIITRCTNPKCKNWHRYGGRGIKVCDRWLYGDGTLSGFECFLGDMGAKPSPKHSIDRHPNNDGDYEPGNCKWSNHTEQARNRHTNHRVTHNGETKCIAEWAEQYQVDSIVLWKRLRRGWGIEKALSIPNITSAVITYNGRTQTFQRWAEETGMSVHTLRHPRHPKPKDWRPRFSGGRCGAWAGSVKRGCQRWPVRGQARCRLHGGIVGELSPEGRKAISEASKREWQKWRQQMGLKPDWRFVHSRRRGGRQTAAQWLAARGSEGERDASH